MKFLVYSKIYNCIFEGFNFGDQLIQFFECIVFPLDICKSCEVRNDTKRFRSILLHNLFP